MGTLEAIGAKMQAGCSYVSVHGKPVLDAIGSTAVKIFELAKQFFIYIGAAIARYAKIYWPKIQAACASGITHIKAWAIANPVFAQIILAVAILALAFFATKMLLNWSATPPKDDQPAPAAGT